MKEKEPKILEWRGAKPKDEALAKKISKKLQLGSIYFTYNVPLQIWIGYNEDDKPKSGISLKKSLILNYMPRKEACKMESLSNIFSNDVEVTAQDLKDFMKISALIIKNLAKQMEKFNPFSETSYVYYPNCR